ncbi:MAG: histidine kinase dimerization/phosphoacceptor domain -containing protein [Pirellulaceae bacterium]|nr:histidine kinase dimerization/phosphoacceptor domain -containing protein [Pirellulaceae bacterium]
MQTGKTLLDKSKVLETVLDSLSEAVLVVDCNGVELIRNRAFERLHSTVLEQVPAEQWSSAFGVFLPGGVRLCPVEQLPMVRALRGEACDEVELQYVGQAHPDGLRVSVNARPLMGDDGVLGGVVAIRDDSSLSERTKRVMALNYQLELEVKKRLAVEEKYRAVVEDQTEVVCRLRADGSFLFVNEVYCRFFGKSQNELIGKLWRPVVHPDDVTIVEAKLATLSPTNPIIIIENRVYDASGDVRWMEFVNRGFFGSDGVLVEIQAVGRDITHRKAIEEQLRKSLLEKEILLKEIHHRVKNNLQVISTLLDLQSNYTQDLMAIEMFRESRMRVKTMALIHENLYRTDDMSQVNIQENIAHLAKHLLSSYDMPRIKVVVEVSPIELAIDTAITCGLIVNELLSNCLKHAFEKDTNGLITVCLRIAASSLVLSVSDDGVGFPASVNFYDTKSFGINLVHLLARKLRGTAELQCEQGTKITIIFPAANALQNAVSEEAL